ncbi:SH3 domain-containing protein [Metabacillus sediminilitoris]|uniref:N-acetylmuramoyl-L-alanine amidase n=1 Tax=Metabacillus sediminilitoris TaxID=2567941 RepID=A0A4S4C2B4_9BACI|nr:SH3 domain-containing protein [Metabacillus sediminilitoris]QGQ47378.1 SH3 domain-containing protein [Metabacillus sediminilitoris]THF81813.1 N-acetylmuramoyl-L-alanine amidase [Metabacillus sediminilitoris]
MIKKGMIIYICMTLLFVAAFLHTEKGSAANDQVIINVDLLNVRSNAALTSSVTAKVKKGQVYDVVEKKNDWIKIKLSRNSTGWVAGWLVTQKKTSATSSSTQSITSGSGTVVSNATGLRFRSGPGTSFGVIGVFEKGKTAAYLEKSGEWIKISYSGKQGWVSSDYVKLNTSNQNSNTASSMNKKASVNATSLNVRKTPSASGVRVGSLKKNATVTVVKEQSNWMQIKTNSLQGWVHSDYLKFDSIDSAKTPSEDSSSTNSNKLNTSGTVTATSLTVRNSGALSGKVVGSVRKGTKVTIIEEKNDWYKINYGTNKSGWVSSRYISKTADSSNNPSNNDSKKKVKIIYDGTNIRSGASTNYSVVKRANSGDLFEIIETVGDWYKIKLGNSNTGYIAGWVVEASGVQSPVTKPGSEQYVKGKTIVIDPGHGGQDSGAVGSRGTLEKNLTLTTAKLVYNKLKSAGANVSLTRSNDTYISLNSRVSTSHYRNAEAFISIHYDSTADRSANGTTTYYYNTLKDGPLASTMNTEVVKQTKLKNRRKKFGNFHVLRENKKPAVLLELGFLSNRTEEITINTSSYQERVSQGIFNGLTQYFK